MSSRDFVSSFRREIPLSPKRGTALADISRGILYFIELSRGLHVGNIYLGLSRN